MLPSNTRKWRASSAASVKWKPFFPVLTVKKRIRPLLPSFRETPEIAFNFILRRLMISEFFFPPLVFDNAGLSYFLLFIFYFLLSSHLEKLRKLLLILFCDG